MNTQEVSTVFIVDDDADVRESLQDLLESVGLTLCLSERHKSSYRPDAVTIPAA